VSLWYISPAPPILKLQRSPAIRETVMDYSTGKPRGGEAPQPRPPEVDTQYDLQWVDLDDDLEEFGRMGACFPIASSGLYV